MGVGFAVLSGGGQKRVHCKVTTEHNLEGDAGSSCVYTLD